jgi:hypothetical protein
MIVPETVVRLFSFARNKKRQSQRERACEKFVGWNHSTVTASNLQKPANPFAPEFQGEQLRLNGLARVLDVYEDLSPYHAEFAGASGKPTSG